MAPRDGEWHLSLEFDDQPQLEAYMVRLSESGPAVEIKNPPLYRSKMNSGRWVDVLYVRYGR